MGDDTRGLSLREQINEICHEQKAWVEQHGNVAEDSRMRFWPRSKYELITWRNLDLSTALLHGVDWSHVRLENTCLDKADLTDARFNHASLNHVRFVNAEMDSIAMEHTLFNHCNFNHTQIWRANLIHSEWYIAEIHNVQFNHSNLCHASFSESKVIDCEFIEANFFSAKFKKSTFYNCTFQGACLENATFPSATFRNCIFREADFARAGFSDTLFIDCDFRNIDFSKVNLVGVYFSCCNFSGATGIPSPIKLLGENFQRTPDGYIAYKSFGYLNKPPESWIIAPGAVIEEVPDPDRSSECGCGINVATLAWVLRYANPETLDSRGNKKPTSGIWKCLIRWEWLPGVVVPYAFDGKVRCEKVELLEILSEDYIGEARRKIRQEECLFY